MEYTGEEYDKKLIELARKAGVDSILTIPGVYELVSEDLNNEIIKAIENEI